MSNNYQSQQNDTIVSYGNKINNKEERVTPVPFATVVEQIKTGSNRLKENIEHLRTLPSATEKEQKARTNYKASNLPYFSMARFADDHRKNNNLISLNHLIFDFDHLNGSLDNVRKQLMLDKNVYLLYTSPSGDGLKVICPIANEITDPKEYKILYPEYAEAFSREHGIEWDKSTVDAARASFLSYDPDVYVNANAVPLDDKNSKKINIQKVLKGTDVGNRTHSVTQFVGMFIDRGFSQDMTLEFVRVWNKQNTTPLADTKLVETIDYMYKNYSKDKAGLANYWSYGTDILEIGIVDSKFYQEKNSEKKVYARVGAFTDEEKARVYSYLVKEKHIAHISVINFLGDIDIPESYYVYDSRKAIIDVHYAVVPVDVQDNKFIEDYLGSTFGQYKQFIKEWLAVYCYTNHEKLPFLVLTGKRGSSKNTFAETVGEIFPSMSTMWHGLEKTFNPECEMKLLIADETISNDMDQYRTLKKYSGQQYTVVNHKYLKPYKVMNNMNVIILSNAKTPIKVERDEVPTNDQNNQFFVYRMKQINGTIDRTLGSKLVARLGHYIRTDLKQVFDNLNMDGNRYTVRTPITPDEKELFENNVTPEEILADAIKEHVRECYIGNRDKEFNRYVNSGYLPGNSVAAIDIPKDIEELDVLKKLVEQGMLKSCEPKRKQIGKERLNRAYMLTDEFVNELQSQIPKVAEVADEWQENLDFYATENGETNKI
jgi:hypothetical protein